AEVEACARQALELRYALLPYLYTVAEEATRTGAPLLRPAWWDEPGDDRLRAADDEALLGAAVLAVPVLDERARRVAVELPAGRWRELATGAVHERGALLDAPLERLPLLVRCGAVLPCGAGR